jgi:type IV pilus assembly protein PilE
MLRSKQRSAGFSLLELMIVVAVIGIIAAIALPSYNEYITRSKIQEATANLSDLRTKMEAYYMDNRRYSSTAGGGTCGTPGGNTPAATKYFTYTCASSAANAAGDQAYIFTATGIANQGMNGFSFTINQSNTKVTTGVGTGWTVPATNCWVQKKTGAC